MTKTEVLDFIGSKVEHPVTEETAADELAMDSLEFIELLSEIEQQTGVHINVSDVETVGDIVNAC